ALTREKTSGSAGPAARVEARGTWRPFFRVTILLRREGYLPGCMNTVYLTGTAKTSDLRAVLRRGSRPPSTLTGTKTAKSFFRWSGMNQRRFASAGPMEEAVTHGHWTVCAVFSTASPN